MTAAIDTHPAARGTAGTTALVDGWTLAIVALSSIQPFAAFLAGNAGKLTNPRAVATDALVWTSFVLIAFVVVRLLTRRSTALPIAFAFVACNLSFWNFGRWLPTEPPSALNRWIGLLVWALVTALLVRLAMRLAAWSSARLFVTLMLAVWTAGSLLTYATATPSGGDLPTTYTGPPFPAFVEHPNVYWLLLDEHANAHQVEKWTGTDTSWFSDDLGARGFSTSQTTHSGYLFTHLSISSTLAMEYAYTPGHDYRSEYPLAVPFIAGDNPVVETFEANGYRYVFAPDGSTEWIDCPEMTGDRTCIDPIAPAFSLREPHTNLVRATPVGSFGLPMVHNDLTSVLDGVDEVRAQDPDRPLFVFGHVLSPHYPYRFEPDCSLRSTPVEGNGYSGEERAAAYGNDVECLDREAVKAVDRIIAGDPDAVIILQGDHGSTLTFNWEQPYDQWTGTNFSERFSALDAIRLPSGCRGDSIEGQPLVNTYRLVLACLSGTEPDLLATRTFYSGYGRIGELTEVTADRLDDS